MWWEEFIEKLQDPHVREEAARALRSLAQRPINMSKHADCLIETLKDPGVCIRTNIAVVLSFMVKKGEVDASKVIQSLNAILDLATNWQIKQALERCQEKLGKPMLL